MNYAKSENNWFVARAPSSLLDSKISFLTKQNTINLMPRSQPQQGKQLHVSELFSEARSGIPGAQWAWRDDSGLESLKSNEHGFIDTSRLEKSDGVNPGIELSDIPGVLYHPDYLYRRFFLNKNLSQQFVEMVPLKIAEKFGYQRQSREAFLIVYLDPKNTEQDDRKNKYIRFLLKSLSAPLEEPIEGHFLFSSESSWVVFPQTPSGDYLLTSVTYSDSLKQGPLEQPLSYFHLSEYEGRIESVALEKNQRRLTAQLLTFGSSRPIRLADVEVLGIPELKTKTDRQGRFSFQMAWDCKQDLYIKIKKARYLSSVSKLQCGSASSEAEMAKIFLMELSEAQQIQEQVSIPREALNGTLVFGQDGQCVSTEETKNVESKATVLEDHKYQIALDPFQNKNHESYDFYYDEEGLLDPDLETTALNQRYVVLEATPGFQYLKSMTPHGENVGIGALYVEKGGAYSVPCTVGP